MKPLEIHRLLSEAREAVNEIMRSPSLENISSDTCMAIGECAGVLDKAKALVGRDIDDINNRAKGAF
jgi:hypothetical protein